MLPIKNIQVGNQFLFKSKFGGWVMTSIEQVGVENGDGKLVNGTGEIVVEFRSASDGVRRLPLDEYRKEAGLIAAPVVSY